MEIIHTMSSRPLSEQLREAASKAESIRALARAASMDHSALLRFIHGKQDIGVSTADRLADALGFELRRRPKRKR